MKEIDIQKVRTAILSLQNSGAKESAQAVWDLLDQYVAQRPKPIVFRKSLEELDAQIQTRANLFRGFSAASGLPKCQVYAWNSESGHCKRLAIGHLVNQERSVLVCGVHGEEFDGRNNGEFVQSFFGDENSASDVALYAKTLEEKL